jgi:hypothetical protein
MFRSRHEIEYTEREHFEIELSRSGEIVPGDVFNVQITTLFKVYQLSRNYCTSLYVNTS